VKSADADVIRLSASNPGSVKWTLPEKQYFSKIWNTEVVTNVSQPTLTVYAPAPGTANGTAVIICPGGAFYALSINSEGVEAAKWLNARGVTAFVLRYRLVPTGADGVQEVMAKLPELDLKRLEADFSPVIPLAIADGASAVAYVRKHAGKLGISPTHIGLMGFSAGGQIAAGVALNHTADTRPDFVASIYPYLGALKDVPTPDDAPPMFVLAAANDQFHLTPDSIALYDKWFGAKKPVELHVYSQGGHGFGMRKQNLPSDQWIDRFDEWLQAQGLMNQSGKTGESR
jgi:acetyl esterase/lipase